jgi:hypothetical protein
MANTEADKIDVLEKAKRAFVTAEAFLEAVHVLVQAVNQGHTRILTLVQATNAAFTLEMYLKSLLLVENGEAEHTHDIYDLFHALKKPTQDELTKEHAKLISDDLEELLKLGRDTFSKFRYAHEKIPSNTVWGLNNLTRCVRTRLLTLHPEWERALDELAQEGA